MMLVSGVSFSPAAQYPQVRTMVSEKVHWHALELHDAKSFAAFVAMERAEKSFLRGCVDGTLALKAGFQRGDQLHSPARPKIISLQ